MEVHRALIDFEQNDGVGRRLVAEIEFFLDLEIEQGLMRGGAQGREGDATPASRDGSKKKWKMAFYY